MKSSRLLKYVCLIILALIAVIAYFSLNHNEGLTAYIQKNQSIGSRKLITIEFNKQISFDSDTKQGITMEDDKGNIVNVTLDFENDKKSVLVNPPLGGYIPGKTYVLNISKNVHSNNLKLSKSINANFNINNKSIPKPIKVNREAKYGDIVGITYNLDVYKYEHYGIYIGDNKVIHYNSSDGTMKNAKIEIGNMESNFPRGRYFVLDFGVDAKYSANDTVKRAESRIGEKNYNLITNNCEHFAVWCKTDNAKSYQIDSLSKAQIQLIKEYVDTGIIPYKIK